VCPSWHEKWLCGHVWGSAEYLVWWVKDGPLAVPLVTANTAGNDPFLGAPGTAVLFGENGIDYGTFSGLRLNAGYWLDRDQRFGLEAGGFVLEQRAQFLTAATDGSLTSPALGRPVVDALTGNEEALIVALPGFVSGGVQVASSTHLWGVDANLLYNVYRTPVMTASVLGGFRFLSLAEDLSIVNHSEVLPGALVPGTFNGLPVDQVVSYGVDDSFTTYNRFYGGQLGGKLDWRFGRLVLGGVAKIALGTTQQSVNVRGASVLVAANPAQGGQANAGLLAVPTNGGKHTRNEFAVVPEVGLNVGFQVTPAVKVFVGYTFLYWSNVLRPGDQVSRVVSLQQVPLHPSFNPAQPATQPVVPFKDADFWAQGVNFGVEVRY
jgi:hypothetical protein